MRPQMAEPLLIVNADDLGRSQEINQGIFYCLKNSLCSSATLMANGPAFEDACAEGQSYAQRIGIHLNLTEGEPLTRAIRGQNRFCNQEGRFCLTRKQRILRLSATEDAAVTEELAAQIARCRQHGFSLTHADSHHHVHEEYGILLVVLRLLKKEHIPFCRIARNTGVQRSKLNFIYRTVLNTLIGYKGLRGTRFFGNVADYSYELNYKSRQTSSWEVMIHPAMDANGAALDTLLNEPLNSIVSCWAGRKLSSYWALSDNSVR